MDDMQGSLAESCYSLVASSEFLKMLVFKINLLCIGQPYYSRLSQKFWAKYPPEVTNFYFLEVFGSMTCSL